MKTNISIEPYEAPTLTILELDLETPILSLSGNPGVNTTAEADEFN